jgi:hypothetical protein
LTQYFLQAHLARHYAHYFESQTPGLESERVANLAWWLAERVGAAFGHEPEQLDRVHSRVVLQAGSLSNQAWELLRPTLVPSSIRFATIHLPSCWSVSLLCQLGQAPGSSPTSESTAEIDSEIRKSLITSLLGSFPPPGQREGSVIYAFDRGLERSAEAWLQSSDTSEEAPILRTVLGWYNASDDAEELRRRIEAIPEASEQEQLVTCCLIRSLAFARKLPDDVIWEFVTREGWLPRVLGSMDLNAVDLPVDALIEHQLQNAGRWTNVVPHLLATAVLLPTQDMERRRVLFAYCLIASLGSGTTDAVARVLYADERTTIERDISYWVERFEAAFPLMPAWGQARLRPILALLSRMRGSITAAELAAEDQETQTEAVATDEQSGHGDPTQNDAEHE